MMEGRNAYGQRVSLLNVDDGAGNSECHRLKQLGHPQLLHLPLLSLRSTAPSSTSTPVMSPSTPDMIRSQSTDSAPGQTPSPITPNFHAFPFLLESRRSGSPFSVSSTSSGTHKCRETYLTYPSMSSYQPLHHSITSGVASSVMAGSTSTSSSDEQESQMTHKSSTGKKNNYPCPLARQLGCNDLFTTSGHAARHAKKHTGKKDALCPECNKAFTRKDNMEQHRRTHRNGRGSSKAGSSARARSKMHQQQVPKKAGVAPSKTATTAFLTRASSGDVDAIKSAMAPSLDTAQTLLARPVSAKRNETSSLAPGLETLAIVASGQL